MNKEELKEICKENIVFEDNNAHITIDDNPYCPFCGSPMKWEDKLVCHCEGQTNYLNDLKNLQEEYNALAIKHENIKSSALEKALPFFKKYLLNKIEENLKEGLDFFNMEEK